MTVVLQTAETPAIGLPPASGVVLAGGASRRLGFDKAGIRLEGETLLARSVRRLAALFPEVLVVTRNGAALPEDVPLLPGVQVIHDRLPGHGPLGGIHAALEASSCDRIFVTACDMPFWDEAAARLIVAASLVHDAAVPLIGRFTEPLLACYARTCLPAVTARLQQDCNQVQAVFESLDVRLVTEAELRLVCDPERICFNVNRLADLARLAGPDPAALEGMPGLC